MELDPGFVELRKAGKERSRKLCHGVGHGRRAWTVDYVDKWLKQNLRSRVERSESVLEGKKKQYRHTFTSAHQGFITAGRCHCQGVGTIRTFFAFGKACKH